MKTLFDADRSTPAIAREGGRIEGDRYYTPEPLARAIVAELLPAGLSAASAWEPHVGGGAFARSLVERGVVAYVSDIDPAAPGLSVPGVLKSWPGHDFLASSSPFRGQGPDWIIGNPPYDQAEAHVRRALELSRRHVVFLLRSAFAESSSRVPFWREHPCRHEWRLAQRPSFIEGGRTDSAAYSVFWWDRQNTGSTTCTHGWDWRGASR